MAFTTFFSYSRTDSEFVLRLAKDLRKNGAEVWLDQLDIKAGRHWDTSIEEALNSAINVIVLISPAAISSNNVMDEVSYALEKGKTVIPILIDECTLPFRLRRLQRIDFTKDYRHGLNQLLNALKNKENGEGTEISKDLTLSTPTLNKKRIPNKYILVGAGIILTAFIIYAIQNIVYKNENRILGKSDTSGVDRKKIADTTQIKKDSSTPIFRPKVDTGKKPPSKIEIGKHYKGGIVFYIDESGKHGLLAGENDLGLMYWDAAKQQCDTITINRVRGWHLPNKNELIKLFNKKDSIPGLTSPAYWTSEKGESKKRCFVDFSNGIPNCSNNDNNNYNVRPVRSF